MAEKETEVDEKVSHKVAAYFAKEFSFSLSFATATVEAAKALSESLNDFSSNQYFSQSTARKWFNLKTDADALAFRAEGAYARLSAFEAAVECAVIRKETPSVPKAEAAACAKEFSEISAKVVEHYGTTAALMEDIKRDFESK